MFKLLILTIIAAFIYGLLEIKNGNSIVVNQSKKNQLEREVKDYTTKFGNEVKKIADGIKEKK